MKNIAKEGDSMDYTIAPINQEELVRIRRQLHMYPELKWDLPLTAALVKEELTKAGIDFVADKYGPNTIVATINPEIDRFTIGIRADMDALIPIYILQASGHVYRGRFVFFQCQMFEIIIQ